MNTNSNNEYFLQISDFSAIFKFVNSVFENFIEKATDATVFWNLSRNPDKMSSKICRKNASFDAEMKNRKFVIHSRKNVDGFFENFLKF